MRSSFSIFILLLSGTAVFAQPSVSRTPAKVIDFGQMYSTYNWDEENTAALRAKVGNALTEKIVLASVESAWPSGIASLTERNNNRSKMAAYTVYYLTTFNESIVVLQVPATENRGMSADMQPASDIYFIINKSGVELNPASTVTVVTVPDAAEGFAAQMNLITENFSDGFVSLTNELLQEDEEGFMLIYSSRVMLEGATQIYFIEDLLAASTIFHAEFPGSADPAVALKVYRGLVQKIGTLKLSVCGLVKQDEQVEGNRYSQFFSTSEKQGKIDIAYENMIIEVSIEQGETFDNAGQLISNWVPVITIYEN